MSRVHPSGRLALIVATAAAQCGACSLGADHPPLRATEQAIINGAVDTNPAHDAVVALTDVDGQQFCTGTYVGMGTIVTAAHCFDNGPPAYVYFGVDEIGDNEACLYGDEQACAMFAVVGDYKLLPTYDKQAIHAGGDIAVLSIGGDPPGVAPIRMLSKATGTQLTAADQGAPIVFVGFGVTDGVAQTGSGVRRAVGGTVEHVGPKMLQLGDGPLALKADQVLAMQRSGGTCQGDSGGPMLIKRNGVEHLVAVTSFGDEGCFEFGVSVLVDVHENFVRAFQGLPPIEDPKPPADPDDPANPDPQDDPEGTHVDDAGCSIGNPNGGPGTPLLVGLAIAVVVAPRRCRRRGTRT